MTDEEKKDIEWEYRVREFAFAIAPMVREFVDQNPEGFQKFLREYEQEQEQKAKAAAENAAENGGAESHATAENPARNGANSGGDGSA